MMSSGGSLAFKCITLFLQHVVYLKSDLRFLIQLQPEVDWLIHKGELCMPKQCVWGGVLSCIYHNATILIIFLPAPLSIFIRTFLTAVHCLWALILGYLLVLHYHHYQLPVA